MTHDADVVAAGHICLDIIPDLRDVRLAAAQDFFTPGKLLNTGEACLSTGGSVSNTGLGLLKLGNRVALMGKVGRDPFGGLVQRLLKERFGVERGLKAAEDAATSYSVILAPAGCDRMILHCPGANETFGAGDIDYGIVGRARLFHFGYPPVMRRMYADGGAELAAIFRRVRELGAAVSLDMSLPDPASESGRADWRGILERVLPHVDLFMPSAEETLYMLDRPRFFALRGRARGEMTELFSGEDLHAFGAELLRMGARVVLIKCGSRGAYVRTAASAALGGMQRAAPGDPASWADRELWHPCLHAERFVSATGSGDAAIAGFLTGLLHGLPLEETLRAAVAAGACNVAAADALTGLKSICEIHAALSAGWPVDPLEVQGAGWRRQGALFAGPGDRES